MTNRNLINEGRTVYAAALGDNPHLLPLDVDRAINRSDTPEDVGFFVCDRLGLEFAGVRNEDEPTAALIAWAINNLPALLDELQEARDHAAWFAAERDELRLDRASELVAIAAKQLRDTARITELEAKHAQHAETPGLLEHAYEVIEAANRPPLGYVALARMAVADRLLAYSQIHPTAAAARGSRYGQNAIIAELREVSDAG